MSPRTVPSLDGTIERRVLVNYRADPELAARLLPRPFRPQLVHGSAVVGLCLIRLGNLRPAGFPIRVGVASENAAHRIAVEWDSPEGTRSGVYIPRRHTDSLLNAVVGGRCFPGEHVRASFTVQETPDVLRIGFASRDGIGVEVRVRPADTIGGRLFGDLGTASEFFRSGTVGFSPRRDGRLDGVEFVTGAWRMEPLELEVAASSFLDDPPTFPTGTLELDGAFVMRDLPVRWRAMSATSGESARPEAEVLPLPR